MTGATLGADAPGGQPRLRPGPAGAPPPRRGRWLPTPARAGKVPASAGLFPTMHAPTTTCPTPAPPPSPPGGPHRFTVTDYYRMADTGVLRPDDRVELLDGQVFDVMPTGPFHASANRRLVNLFARLGGDRWIVCAQNPVHVNDGSEPQPDFVLLRPREDFYATGHPTPADVFLFVEVADSSLLFDREKKLPLYARAGVAELWLVNLVARNVEIYRRPDGTGGYGETFVAAGADRLAPAAFPDAGLTVAQLLGGNA